MRVYVVAEGQTEERVVKRVLAPHLAPMGVYLSPIVVQTSRGHRGGGRRWSRWENDIRRLLRQHRGPEVRLTTMFDLFRLPRDFPGLAEHGADPDTNRRCDALQAAMAEAIGDWRLIPYLQRHELEALVLGSLDSLENLFDDSEALRGLGELRDEIGDRPPEDINDGPETAPSKRLERHIPGYRKALHGPLAIGDTGLEALRARCPRFHRWLETLEGLAQEHSP